MKLTANDKHERDDWVTALEDVKATYDKEYPEVAAAGEHPCAAVASESLARGLACRAVLAVAWRKAWLAAALAVWRPLLAAAFKNFLRENFDFSAPDSGAYDGWPHAPPGGEKALIDQPPWSLKRKLRGVGATVKLLAEEFADDLRSDAARLAATVKPVWSGATVDLRSDSGKNCWSL